MGKFIDLTNMTFGRLKVLYRDETSYGKPTYWVCQCECGNTVSVLRQSLIGGMTKSCGCFRRERSAEAMRTMARINAEHRTCNYTSKPRTSSGVTGVVRDRNSGAWKATIGWKGMKYSLGTYTRFASAVDARNKAVERVKAGLPPKEGRRNNG